MPPVLLRRARIAGALAALLPLLLAPASAAAATSSSSPSWRLLHTGHPSHFRGLSAVNERVAWLGGYDGTILRTTNGGRTWRDVSPTGAGALQFRDIEAFSASHAVAMAAGEGRDSRLYVTFSGGRHWRLAYTNRHPAAFYDCMAFFDSRYGLTMSDPVNGKFRILATRDGGRHWRIQSPAGMPAARAGEFGFAAGGGCLTTRGAHDAWFGTGGAAARVFHSTNRGRTWTVSATPIAAGDSAGIFAVAFRDRLQGIAIGGDFAAPNAARQAVALTADGGRTWTLVGKAAAPNGYRSGLTFVPGTRGTALAVGLSGSDITRDGGFHWQHFGSGQFDGVDCAAGNACWASGDKGRVARLTGRR